MMTICFVCVGNLKEKFSRDAAAEYIKRLGAFCKTHVVEVREHNEQPNPAKVLEKEGEEILKNLKGFVVLCDLAGTQLSSEEFSAFLSSTSQKNSTITFVVGGSHGVSAQVKAAADATICFSKMTFPHNLFRIMLLEQTYRAFMIDAGKSYHK